MDESEFQVEFARHLGAVYQAARSVTGDPDEAQDVVQDTYLRYAAVPRESIQSPRALLATIVLFVWSMAMQAPLEGIANLNVTPNPSKAPWYFVGLQELLVYFDPWIAGVVLPTAIIVGLMAIPYVDVNPRGVGQYPTMARRGALWVPTERPFAFRKV